MQKGGQLWQEKVYRVKLILSSRNDYANQHNPNNKAYKANQKNQESTKPKKTKGKKYDMGILDGESYGWCDD